MCEQRKKVLKPDGEQAPASHIKKSCILDGEYVAVKDGKPNFSEVQRRSLMSNPFKIKLAAEKLPVSFVAFDILWMDGKDLMQQPLMARKEVLRKAVSDSERMAVSRVVETGGTALYRLAEQHGLEGIVAKRRDSLYWPGKRTKDWIKSFWMTTLWCAATSTRARE